MIMMHILFTNMSTSQVHPTHFYLQCLEGKCMWQKILKLLCSSKWKDKYSASALSVYFIQKFNFAPGFHCEVKVMVAVWRSTLVTSSCFAEIKMKNVLLWWLLTPTYLMHIERFLIHSYSSYSNLNAKMGCYKSYSKDHACNE